MAKTDGMTEFGDTVDRQDIDRFAAQAASWWDPRGSFRPLHQINPVRLDFIRRELLAHFRRAIPARCRRSPDCVWPISAAAAG